LVLLPIAYIVYSESLLDPLSMFTWVYGGLVVLETLALLSLGLLLVRLSSRNPATLSRKVRLPGPVRALATLTLLGGLSVFGFWVVVDLLSGYQSFPAYAFSSHPLTFAIYKGIGLNALPLPDKDRAIGLFAFGVAVLSFMALRAKRGVGVALRDGVLFFAAPLMIAFELALWDYAPSEMYWHATDLVPWSLDRYLTSQQFVDVTEAPLHFVWGGNIYLLSNWLVLLAASGLLALGVVLARSRGRPEQTEELGTG